MDEEARAAWHAIGDLARWVPTPHNTQPYRIRPLDGTTAELVLVCERLLPAEDHGNLYVLSAFGLFAAAIERAGRAVGWHVTTSPRDDFDGRRLERTSRDIVVGTATIEGTIDPQRTDLLATRRTSRLAYHDRAIEPAVQDELTRIVAASGHELVVLSDPRMVREVLWMNAEAIVDNLQISRERQEIRQWYRFGDTPRYGDGLWQRPMNQSAWQIKAAFGVPRLFACEPIRTLAIQRYVARQSTRHVALLHGPFATWSELVSAGRMLLELWLAMAASGIYMHPFGSMLTNPAHAGWVAHTFGRADTWLVVRLGYSDLPPAAPRLASIVMS